MIHRLQLKIPSTNDLKAYHTMSLQKYIGNNLNSKSLEQFQDEYHDNATILRRVGEVCVLGG